MTDDTPGDNDVYAQAAGIPFRLRAGTVEILVVTNRSGNRWIIPKGLIDEGYSLLETVEKEAYEEAGIRGRALDVRLDAYTYRKWGGTCRVVVVPMEVTDILDRWPEDDLRERRWLSPPELAAVVDERIPRGILETFGEWFREHFGTEIG